MQNMSDISHTKEKNLDLLPQGQVKWLEKQQNESPK